MRLLSYLLLISLLWSAPAHAGGIITAIGALFTAVKASAIGGLLLRVALTVGLSLLQQKKARKRQQQPGLQTQFRTFGGTQSQTTILGRFATKGHENYRNSHGPNNKYLTQVIELGDLPGISLERVFIDGEASELGTDEHPDYGRPILSKRKTLGSPPFERVDDYAWVKFYDGTQTSADPMLRDKYGDDPDRPIDADYILSGVPYAIVILRSDRTQFPSGDPEITFECLGIPLYDPRKDSSVGGAGTQRWNDPSSWTRSANPIVQSYNIARGLTLPDGTVYGGGADAEDIPLDSTFAAMNVCDEDIGGRPRYSAGIEIKFAEDEPADVIEDLLEAANAQIAELGGMIYFQAGAPSASITSINDGDIVVSDPTQMNPFPGFESQFNAVAITHPSPNAGWNGRELDLIEKSAWVTKDGERRAFDLSLSTVYSAEQARQLGQSVLNDQRRFRRHVLPLPPDKFFLKPLDNLDWDSDRNGYDAKQFEVFEAAYDLYTLNVKVSIRERDAGDFIPDPALETPDAPAVTAPVAPSDAGVPGFNALAVVLRDQDGGDRRPALRLAWTPDDIVDTIDALAFEVRLADTEDPVWDGTTSDISSAMITVQPVLPAQTYKARARAISPRRETLWTAWVTVTTDDIRLSSADMVDALNEKIDTAFDRHDASVEDADGTVAELRDRIAGYLGDIGVPSGGTVGDLPRLALDERLALEVPNIRDTERNLLDAEDTLLEQAIGEFAGAQKRAVLAAKLDEAKAQITREEKARVTEDSALAALVQTLEAQVGSNAAAITEEATARAGADSALSGRVETVEATLEDPDTGLSARVQTIEGAYVDADGAVAAVDQEVSATFGTLEAMADATAYAEATAEGIEAGFIWQLNGQNVLEAVSVSDGVGGPVQTFKIASDYVQITGIAQIDTAVIEDLAAQNALVENLEVTGSMIVDGAVSQGAFHTRAGTSDLVLTANSPATAQPVFGTQTASLDMVQYNGTPPQNPLVVEVAGVAKAVTGLPCRIAFGVQGRSSGGSWTRVDGIQQVAVFLYDTDPHDFSLKLTDMTSGSQATDYDELRVVAHLVQAFGFNGTEAELWETVTAEFRQLNR